VHQGYVTFPSYSYLLNVPDSALSIFVRAKPLALIYVQSFRFRFPPARLADRSIFSALLAILSQKT
jgi:hypothetical protein